MSSRTREGGSLPPTKFENVVCLGAGYQQLSQQPPVLPWDTSKVSPYLRISDSVRLNLDPTLQNRNTKVQFFKEGQDLEQICIKTLT